MNVHAFCSDARCCGDVEGLRNPEPLKGAECVTRVPRLVTDCEFAHVQISGCGDIWGPQNQLRRDFGLIREQIDISLFASVSQMIPDEINEIDGSEVRARSKPLRVGYPTEGA
jgi:hypothetical protein